MIALLFSPFLFFVIGLIFTTIHPTRRILGSWLRAAKAQENPPQGTPRDAVSGGGTEELRSIFAAFDEDADGYITRRELEKSLKKMGIWSGEEELDEMMMNADSNGDGLIDFREFSSLFDSISSAKNGGPVEDGDLKRAFDVFDGNGDGRITVEELGTALCSLGFTEGKAVENCQEMIRKVDADGDGMVSFDEFKEMMKNGLGSPS